MFIYTDTRCVTRSGYIKKKMDYKLLVMLLAGILIGRAAAQLLAPYAGPAGGLATFGLTPQAMELARGTVANFLGMASGIVGKHFWEKQWGNPQAWNLPASQ